VSGSSIQGFSIIRQLQLPNDEFTSSNKEFLSQRSGILGFLFFLSLAHTYQLLLQISYIVTLYKNIKIFYEYFLLRKFFELSLHLKHTNEFFAVTDKVVFTISSLKVLISLLNTSALAMERAMEILD
jgi:hypothetical protein